MKFQVKVGTEFEMKASVSKGSFKWWMIGVILFVTTIVSVAVTINIYT